MVKIITDSSSLYTEKEAEEIGIQAVPLCISIDDWDGRDLIMDMERFYGMIEEGKVPRSSQPPIGEVMEAYEKVKDTDAINISMADGLSGTYASACSAKEMVEDNEKIAVFNSQTLCGPHRYMVQQAMKWAKEGMSKSDILGKLQGLVDKTDSFLIPQDFEFLRRGGRLTPLASKIGGILNLKIILKLTPDGKRLDKFGAKRSMKSAAVSVAKSLQKKGLDERHIIYVCHANVIQDAMKVYEVITESFPKAEVKLYKLSPAFVTQGGPGCIAIQYIEK